MEQIYTITRNEQYGSLEISFDGKPSEAVRDALKALHFRWHGVKKVWYGHADEQTVQEAIEGLNDSNPRELRTGSGTPQDRVRILWNGIKADGKLHKCFYSIGAEDISIYARDCDNLPRGFFPVRNDSDSYTDYFDNDSAYLAPDHPFYPYVRYAAMKADARMASRQIKHLEKELQEGREPWPGRLASVRKDLETFRARVAQFEAADDPGQPTQEDLNRIDEQKQQAENARAKAEREEEQRRREKEICKRINGRHLIEEQKKRFPRKDDEPIVIINWSEHSAFSSWAEDELLLSVAAADIILGTLDAENHDDEERGYDKTKFTISGKDESGELFTYVGRYDLGDGEGGMIRHIRALGEWELTHDQFGHEKPVPDETNYRVRLADYLQQFAAKSA